MINTIPIGSICKYNAGSNYKANDIILVNYKNEIFSREMVSCLRIVGVPGDIVKIEDGIIYRNNREFPFPQTAVLNYKVAFNKTADSTHEIAFGVVTKSYLPESYLSSKAELSALMKRNIVDSFRRKSFLRTDKNLRPGPSFTEGWNMDYFGPIRIKIKGENLKNDEYKFYYGTKSYDTQLNEEYFFVVADNFYQAFDSRIIGLIPKRNIIGKIVDVDRSNARKEIKIN